jgi:hypothetical protein
MSNHLVRVVSRFYCCDVDLVVVFVVVVVFDVEVNDEADVLVAWSSTLSFLVLLG